MPSDSPTARDLARRLIEREPASAGTLDDTVGAAHGATERVYRELTQWVGSSGCQALFVRALSDAKSNHPALRGVRVNPNGNDRIEGIAEAARTAGASPTAAGLEDLLRILIDLLGRFIGEDMAVRLVTGSAIDPASEGREFGKLEE